MTKEQAISIIRKEFLCVDRDCDIERKCGKCDLMMPTKEPILEAYKMAIEALSEPKQGEWIEEDMFDGDVAYRCSACNELFCIIEGTPKDNEYNYCPNCGARMENKV